MLPEFLQKGFPVELAIRNDVQLLFEPGGEIIFHIAPEEVLKERRHEASLVLGDQLFLLDADIVAIFQRGEGRRICRRAADAELFKLLDQ